MFQIEQSPAVMLLRSDNAGFIISFFQSLFGDTQRFQIGYNEFVASLRQYNESYNKPLVRKPQDYVELWADEKHRFLRKYYVEGDDEPQIELSHDISSMMSWLHNQGNQEFVGTESRVSTLFQMIDQLASYSDTDPKARISKLKQDKEAIEAEMAHIKKTGIVPGWDDLRKREYLSHIMEDTRRLLADFALIEDIFKEHARLLKENMVSTQLTKGDILAQVLDMHDALEASDQGKSFQAFWNFLMSPTKQEALTSALEKILNDLSDKPYLKGMQHRDYTARLKGFKFDFLKRGRKVLTSRNRLSREIRTLLVQNANQKAQAMRTTMTDFKALWIAHKEQFAHSATDILIDLEYKPWVHLPLERPLWSEPANTTLDFGDLIHTSSAEIDPLHLAKQPSLALWQLEERVDYLLQNKFSFTLPELIETYPPELELEELAGYLALGMKHQQHHVDRDLPITLNNLYVPQVTFSRKQTEHHDV